MTTRPTAYSYVRFSHPEQARGDSLHRQTEKAENWCQRNGVALDTATTFRDLGRSAYLGEHRKNPERHALAAFLKMVEQGKVPRGSYLIIENLDRLSREHIRPALTLLLNLIEAGVRVVQLRPVEMVYDDKVEPMALMMAIMELSRGHNESAMKSERVGAAWREKRRRAQAGEQQQPTRRMGEASRLLTHRLPAWVEEKAGKPVLIPDRAAVVRRIFELASSGYGIPAIISRLEKEGVPPFGRVGRWTRSYVLIILKDRRAMGELQPKKGKDLDGPVIPDYYPAVVSLDEFHAARAGANERRTNRGRLSTHQVNIFSGILKHARDGDNYIMTQRLSKSKGKLLRRFSVLINTASEVRRSRAYSFPYAPFERAVLSCLREIDPHEIINGRSGTDDVLVLSGELDSVEAELVEASAYMEAHGFSPTIGKRISGLEARKAELTARRAEAQQKAAHPLSGTWGELPALLDALDAAQDQQDARLRLRTALRRMVEGIWLLVVPRSNKDRLAAVQIVFTGGERVRTYLVLHRSNYSNGAVSRPEQWWVHSLAAVLPAGKSLPETLDLRKPADAARLERALLAVDLNS